MSYPSEIIFNSLINENSLSDIDLKDKQLAERTLNANMIYKLWKISTTFITNSKTISDVINQYINRSPCDENEIQWIYQISSNLSPDFNLIIPKFEPIDLLYLIAIKKSNEYRNGPMFIGLKNINFLRNMKSLFKQKFNSFKEVALEIGLITFKTIISPIDAPPKEYEQLKSVFKNPPKLSLTNNSIIQKINQIFTIAESLDQWQDHQLLFDDIKFLSENWIEIGEFSNRFPSLYF